MGQANETQVTNKKRLPTERRRILVKYYLQLEGWGPSQIAKAITKKEKIKVDRKTISDDLQIISAENDTWVNNQASIGWMSKVRDMTNDTMTEEIYLSQTLKHNRDYHDFLELLKQENQKPTPNIEYIETLEAQIISFESSKLSTKEIIMLERAINDKRRLLMEIVEMQPLYQKTKKYAQFYLEHQANTVKPDEK